MGMKMKTRYATYAIPFLLAMLCASAYSTAGISQLLSQYNISTQISSSITFTNISYSGDSYVLLYHSGSPYFLVNVTSGYSFVTNQGEIYNIIRNSTISAGLSKANFTALSVLMHQYENSSAAPLNDCLVETGLSQSGSSCTLANECQSCRTVPVCSKVLSATGGPSDSFGVGISKFESQYVNLTNSYQLFYAHTEGVNASNAQEFLGYINSAYKNISYITNNIYQNPIFPPTSTINSSDLTKCTSNPNTSPWYCFAVGFCEFTTYNYTKLSNIGNLLGYINSLPITNQQVEGVASDVSSTEARYIEPVIDQRQTSQFNAIMNSTLLKYNSTVEEANTLLSHVNNSTLSSELASLQANYSLLRSNYLSLNLSRENLTLKGQLSNLTATYDSLNKTYAKLLNISSDNLALILKLQLTKSFNQSIVLNLSRQEAALSGDLSGRVSNILYVQAALVGLNNKSKNYTARALNDPLVSISRGVGRSFATAVASFTGLPYVANVQLAPVYAEVPAIIISVILLGIVLYAYEYLKKKYNVHKKKHAKKNWNIVWAIAILLILAYLAISYSTSASLNSGAGVNSFEGAVNASNTIAIVINGSLTPGISSCYNAISSGARLINKTVISANFSYGICSSQGRKTSEDICMNSYASSGIPVVLLENSSRNNISIYSFYGTVLTLRGNSTYVASCPVKFLIK
jgi:hypothetical protein